MKLTIMRKVIDKSDQDESGKVIIFRELKPLTKNPLVLLRNLLRYEEVVLRDYRLDTIARPFPLAVLLRLISHGPIYFRDDSGQQLQITLGYLIKSGFNFVKDSLRKSALYEEYQQMVKDLNEADAKPNQKTLDLSHSPLYLRTDMAFGYRAGGSIGHIAGVLNNLSQFTGEPIFVTTDFIPTVNENIPQNTVNCSTNFWNFPETLTLAVNPIIRSFTEDQIEGRSLSFIYQRYSLNNFTGVELAHKYKLPFVLEYNGSEVWIRRHWGDTTLSNEQLSIDIELLNFSAADVIVVVSSPLRDELIELGVDADKILVNPNGVDPERYSPQIDGSAIRQQYDFQDKIVIGFIGTFGAWHGAEVLAEAYGLLLQKHPDYKDTLRLLLIGDGQKMPLVKDNLNQYDALPYTILTGRIPQAEGAAYLAACDILASPHVPNPDGTPFFGSPTKLFEYMAMGRGIVASDLDQIGDILDHNQTAYMVTPGDAQSLADGLKALIDDAALRLRLGEAARQDVIANYTWYEHTRKIMDKLKARFA